MTREQTIQRLRLAARNLEIQREADPLCATQPRLRECYDELIQRVALALKVHEAPDLPPTLTLQ